MNELGIIREGKLCEENIRIYYVRKILCEEKITTYIFPVYIVSFIISSKNILQINDKLLSIVSYMLSNVYSCIIQTTFKMQNNSISSKFS